MLSLSMTLMHQLTTIAPQYCSNGFKVLLLYLSASVYKLLLTTLLSSTLLSHYQFSN